MELLTDKSGVTTVMRGQFIYAQLHVSHRITLVDPCLYANHMCHHSLCMKENHISIESHSINDNMQFYIIQNMVWSRGIHPMAVRVEKKNCKKLNFFESYVQ